MSIEGQGHFFAIYFPGFVCFVLYKATISGERLQDHWSSDYEDLTKIIFELSSNIINFKYAPYFSSPEGEAEGSQGELIVYRSIRVRV